jgi:di/tricarboxylate transporter
MTPALLSLIALLLAIVVSMSSRINVGLLAIVMAWLVGVYAAGLSPSDVIAGFPSGLFLTLAGVTLLFALAETTGTLAALAALALGVTRGNRLLVPCLLFAITGLLSAAGPGAISATALVIPIAANLGRQLRLPPLLIALMVANGANAGNLSPISTVGIIANSRMAVAGISGEEVKVVAANFLAHALVALFAYAAFVILDRGGRGAVSARPALTKLTRAQLVTAAVLALWIAGVVGIGMDVGASAFAAASALLLLRTAEENPVLLKMPWGVMLMVCGVATLVALLERTGGMDLFTALLSELATPSTINGVIAFVTGAISAYSSTSGVVLPAFLPTIPGLIENLGGGDPLAIALSINVGASLVDVSPISTIGAICVAAVADPAASKRLFFQMFVWGMSMTLVRRRHLLSVRRHAVCRLSELRASECEAHLARLV